MYSFEVTDFVGRVLRLFFLLSPFCTLSLLLGFSDDMSAEAQKRLGLRISIAIWIVSLIFYYFGSFIFDFLGISLDAFRVGAGLVLLLNGIDLVRGSGIPSGRRCDLGEGDISVVPMTIPYTVGPGTIGALMLLGGNAKGNLSTMFIESLIITLVGVLMGILLYNSRRLESILKKKGLSILGKLTGMYLVSLAAQIIFAGVRGLCGIVISQ